MLGRVGFAQTHNNIQRAIANNNSKAANLSEQLSSQNRVQELRNDPMAAAHGTRYASTIARKEVFVEQNRETYDKLQLSEGYVRQSVDILQRARELSVQAANGTFTQDDRQYMAEEINQLIEELGVVANAQDGEGRYLFGGTRTNIPPFTTMRTVSDRMHKDVITKVEYAGSNRANQVEISDDDIVSNSVPGNELFWTQHNTIVGGSEVIGYTVPEDSEIVINNITISLSRGDSVYSVVKKINESPASMNATINEFSGKLEIIGSNGTQAWISDKSGSVMQDLGIINNTSTPPYNISSNASSYEETVFDSLIALRDSMYEDNYGEIGGRSISSIDKSMDAILNGLGKIGATTSRLDIVFQRLDEKDIPNLTKQLDEQIGVDMAETVVQWQELVQAQQAAYQVSSQVMQTSLLNYLR